MRSILTVGAATSMLALVILALQTQADATRDSLPAPENATASWEAYNTTTTLFSDLTVSLSNAVPLALMVAFIVSILVLAWGVGGR